MRTYLLLALIISIGTSHGITPPGGGTEGCCSSTTTTTSSATLPEPGQLHIYKFNDHNGNGRWDQEDKELGGFMFSITGPVSLTLIASEQGQAYADDLPPGAYTVSENVPDGWIVTTDNPQIVLIESSHTRVARFGNKQAPVSTTKPAETSSTTLAATCTKCVDGTACGALNGRDRRCICSGVCASYPEDCEFICELGDEPTTTTFSSTSTTRRRHQEKDSSCCGQQEPPNKPGEVVSACADNITDYQETDVDCGGKCGPCDNGMRCVKSADCKSGNCHDRTCTQTYCTDGLKNVDETDVDCGGSCIPCPDSKKCRLDADCMDSDCLGGMCGGGAPTTSLHIVPSCFNGLKDPDEMDVDCAGQCKRCAMGNNCATDADCQSNYCHEGLCKTPSCSDGIKNQNEIGIDCDGPCGPCGTEGSTGFLGEITTLNNMLLLAVILILLFFLRGSSRQKDEGKKDIDAVSKATTSGKGL